MKSKDVKKELKKHANPQKKIILQKFFKTGKGEYAEGDIFLGITVPISRQIAIKFKQLPISEIKILLHSKIHEERLIALFILVELFNSKKQKISEDYKKEIIDFYLSNTHYINNWDLVDLSAPKILGNYLFDNKKQRKILYKLSRSKNLWERRISILSTFYFISKNDFNDAIKISKILINDKHDLIHKAVGWMLREIGKRDNNILIEFLNEKYRIMPRTMLRYSIEKLSDSERKYYMKK